MEDSTHIDSTKISLYVQQLEFTVCPVLKKVYSD